MFIVPMQKLTVPANFVCCADVEINRTRKSHQILNLLINTYHINNFLFQNLKKIKIKSYLESANSYSFP